MNEVFSDHLKSWHHRKGWGRQKAANMLGVPVSTYNGWCSGRPCQTETTIRKLMACINYAEYHHLTIPGVND